MPLSVFVLAIGAFAICTTEFVIMGLLLEIAQDLQISISGAGFLVTGYALGVVVGAPLLMPFLIKTPRKAALVSLMVLFVFGNIACALAPTYDTLLAARVVTAFVQANFFGVGSIVAARLAPPGRQASAIAAMFLGVTLANVVGAPVGTMLGQEYGWRMTFVAVAVIGVLATVSTAMLVPSIPKDEEQPNLRQEFSVLTQPAVLRALLITVLGFGGIFTVFTYIAPLMTQVTGMPGATVPAVILLFGVGMVIGNPIGGRMADRSLLLSLRLSLLLLIGSLALLAVAMYDPITMVAAVFLFGIAGFTTLTPLQVHVLAVAAKAPTLAAAFNIGAFNLGNAAGAWLGGLTIDGSLGPTAVPWVGALISLSGLALTLTVRSREPKLASS